MWQGEVDNMCGSEWKIRVDQRRIELRDGGGELGVDRQES